MKLACLALLTCLALPLCAEAKTKKSSGKSSSGSQSPQPAKNKLIDMTVPAAELPEGLISSEIGGRDMEFFMTAYEIGGLETWLGEQAKVHGEADKVKAVGDALQSTQAEENELLAKLAKRKGMTLPEVPLKSAGRQKIEVDLAKLTGPAFDSAVMEQIGVVTQQAVNAYQSATSSQDADIQNFAKQILPMAKEKLVLARKLAGKSLPPGSKPGFRDNAIPAPPK